MSIDTHRALRDAEAMIDLLEALRALEQDVRAQPRFAARLENGRELLAEFEVQARRMMKEILAQMQGATAARSSSARDRLRCTQAGV